MEHTKIRVTRSLEVIHPDQTRVLLRPFEPGDATKVRRIVERVLDLTEECVRELLAEVTKEFSKRHEDIEKRMATRFSQLPPLPEGRAAISEERRLLLGSCFLAEYSLESAALFNPSIVHHPDQSGLPEGAVRFVLSLRATGEGHISSITFRAGIIYADSRIEILNPEGFLTEPRPVHSSTGATLVQFRPDQDISERILFPTTLAQSNGIEDARFVRFHDDTCSDDGTGCMYYATFTAYNGRNIMPEMLETPDFLRFRFVTLKGSGIQNKGMALFPRKIGGRYAMLSRQDNENIYLMYSDHVDEWNERQVLLTPKYPWELVQIGNCGSPIETSAGWLVISHGVGPMRRYCIGAFLLDLDDPSKVLGRLEEPLLQPNEKEREGYVPNVVYSCGSMLHKDQLHGDNLILPYGLADHATGFATVELRQILAAMKPNDS